MIQRSAAILALLTLFVPPHTSAAQERVGLVGNAALGKDTISRHSYGHFAEHLGRDIYDGIWYREGTGPWHLRDDIITALRKIKVPNLRWPGGCFADYYHWEDGIGPPAQRPKMVNTVWGGVTEDNSFGTHEYLELVRRFGGGPFLVGNVGGGAGRGVAGWGGEWNPPGGGAPAGRR